jgi:MFS family permease
LLLPVLLAASTLTVMARAILGPVVAEIARSLQLSPTKAGQIITTHGITIAVVSLAAGRLIDRIGPRLPLYIGLIVYGVAGGVGLFIRDYQLLLLSRVFLGLGVAGIFTSVTVTVLRTYQGERQQQVMGWRGSGNSIGGAIWPLIGGGLGAIAWYMPFAVYLLGIPLGVLALFVVPKLPGKEPSRKKQEKSVPRRINPGLLLPYLSMFTANLLLYAIVVFFPQRLGQFGIKNTMTTNNGWNLSKYR